MRLTICKGINMEKRIEWLDVLRGILILFVILSHSYPASVYRYFFTPFFLSMFFFVSGYTFSTKKNVMVFLKNKAKRLLVPFLVLGIARVAMAYILSGGSLVERLRGFVLQISCEYDELWFVSCLFSCSVLFYGIVRMVQKQNITRQKWLLLGITFGALAISLVDMCIWKVRLPWELELACFMSFYMALGYLYRRYEIYINRIFERPLLVIGFMVVYLVGMLPQKLETDIHAERIPYPVLLVVLSLVAIIPLVYVAKLLGKSKIGNVLSFLGKNTLFYYAFAGIVRIVLYMVFEKVGIQPDLYITPILCTVLSAITLAFPAWFVRKYMPWAVGA